MRKTLFLLAVSGYLAVTAPPAGGAAAQPLEVGNTPLILASATPLTWDDQMQDFLRRLRVKLQIPGQGSPLKEVAAALRIQLDLFGLPDGLSADDLHELETISVGLRDCASGEIKPPTGTDFELVVMLHDLGFDVLKAVELY